MHRGTSPKLFSTLPLTSPSVTKSFSKTAAKGISPVIASIILVLVVLSLTSAYTIFTGRLAQQQTAGGEQQAQELTRAATTLFKIEDVRGQSIVLRNTGQQVLQPGSVRVSLANEQLNYTMGGPIQPGETGTLTVQGLWRVGPGRRFLEVKGAAFGDGMTVLIEPADGVVLDMRFDEGSGTIAYDSSGNGNSGTLGGGNASRIPSWREGKLSGALDFDATDDIVYVPRSASLDSASTQITVESWFYLNAHKADRSSVLSKNDGVSCGDLHYEVLPDGAFRFALRARGSVCDVILSYASNTTIPTNEWVHVTASYDGTLPPIPRIFINGVESSVYNKSYGDVTTPGPINTGDWWVSSDSGLDARIWDGLIDEVRVYNRALTPDQLYIMRRP